MPIAHVSTRIAWPPAGRYVLAVSGGLDSMALLSLFSAAQKQNRHELVVAHVNHGLRPDAAEDEALVRQAAMAADIAFVTTHLQLPDRSEATARAARYAFLQQTMLEHSAQAIITAHTRDDQLETIVFAALRTDSGRGLAGIRSAEPLLRPLLDISKVDLLDYARERHMTWREDSTNSDPRYARNAIRQALLPALLAAQPAVGTELLSAAQQLAATQDRVATLTSHWLSQHTREQAGQVTIERSAFARQELPVATELLVAVLRHYFATIEPLRERIHEAARVAKTARQGQVDMGGGLSLTVTKETIALLIALDVPRS